MKVFLGGTCNESTWRDEIIPMLRIDYFNPVVEDWTPACQEEELKQREGCDYLLYVITPAMTGVYSIAEAVDDSNKRPNKTIFVTLREDYRPNRGYDCLIRFDDGQWKSLKAVARMVKDNGAAVFEDLRSAAKYLNERSAEALRSIAEADEYETYLAS